MAIAIGCNFPAYPQVSSESLPDGGTQYDYNVGGVTTSFLVPPAGWNAATATEAEREQYGIFPPSDPSLVSDWQNYLSIASYDPPPSVLISPPIASTDYVQGFINWAGYIMQPDLQTTPKFTDAYGTYNEPSRNSTQHCVNDVTLFWLGMGGYNSSALEQEGTGLGGPGLAQDQAWVEYLPYQKYVVAVNLYASTGKQFVEEIYRHTYAGQDRFSFYMANYATGKSALVNEAVGAHNDTTTAEAILERPLITNTQTGQQFWANLTEYGPNSTFTQRSAAAGQYNGPDYGIAHYPWTQGQMYNDNGVYQMTNTSDLNNNGYGFNVQLYNCNGAPT